MAAILAHELTHAATHDACADMQRDVREVVAESVAFTACSRFGLDLALRSGDDVTGRLAAAGSRSGGVPHGIYWNHSPFFA